MCRRERLYRFCIGRRRHEQQLSHLPPLAGPLVRAPVRARLLRIFFNLKFLHTGSKQQSSGGVRQEVVGGHVACQRLKIVTMMTTTSLAKSQRSPVGREQQAAVCTSRRRVAPKTIDMLLLVSNLPARCRGGRVLADNSGGCRRHGPAGPVGSLADAHNLLPSPMATRGRPASRKRKAPPAGDDADGTVLSHTIADSRSGAGGSTSGDVRGARGDVTVTPPPPTGPTVGPPDASQPPAAARPEKLDKRFKCRYCDYESHQAAVLVVHERTHTGERPFACGFPGCTFRARQMSSIVRHQRTHTGEKPYACNLCSYRATQKR